MVTLFRRSIDRLQNQSHALSPMESSFGIEENQGQSMLSVGRTDRHSPYGTGQAVLHFGPFSVDQSLRNAVPLKSIVYSGEEWL